MIQNNYKNLIVGNSRLLSNIEKSVKEFSNIFARSLTPSSSGTTYSFKHESFDRNGYSHLIVVDNFGKEIAGVEYNLFEDSLFPIEGLSGEVQDDYISHLNNFMGKKIFN
jgi:hypothetical protein